MSEGQSVFLRLGHYLFFLKMEMKQCAKTGTGRARAMNPSRLVEEQFGEELLPSALPCPLLLWSSIYSHSQSSQSDTSAWLGACPLHPSETSL